MFGYSLPLIMGRVFGLPLFVLGVMFLVRYRKVDEPKRIFRECLRSPWVWFCLVLSIIAFIGEIIYVSNQT